MRVNVFRCTKCPAWVVIPPLKTEDRRIKHCNNCGADFYFTNKELQSREVPDELARRGWFLESEVSAPPKK